MASQGQTVLLICPRAPLTSGSPSCSPGAQARSQFALRRNLAEGDGKATVSGVLRGQRDIPIIVRMRLRPPVSFL